MNVEIPSALLARARNAASSFRALNRVIGLLTGMLPDTDEGNELVEIRDRLEREFNQLVTTSGLALEDGIRKLESEVVQLEARVEALDRGIPMGWFREHFDASQASSVALADYASLLGRHVQDSSLRLDRVQFLLTRVVSFFMDPADATPARRRSLLTEALPPVTLDETSRQTAVAFFADAAKRVKSFERLKQLIDSGFFVDVRGYKLSLRQNLLDPEVMAAAIELNEAINDNLRRLAAADSPEGKELEAHLADVDAHIKSIFHKLREDESKTQEHFDRWLALNAQKRARKPGTSFKDFKPPGEKAKRFDRRVVMSVILAVLLVVTWVRWPGGGALKEVPAGDLSSLSPLLVSGSVAPPDNPRIFVGQIDKSRWALLPLDERRKEADALTQKLSARGLLAATVMMEQQVVVQIEQGRVLLVQ